jgi:hypothetical protein
MPRSLVFNLVCQCLCQLKAINGVIKREIINTSSHHLVRCYCFALHQNPPPIANSNIVMSEAVDKTRRQLLADHKAFLHKDKWISLLQACGQPPNETERKQLDDAISSGRKKSFKERILHGDRLYPDIYQLAKLLYHTYKLDDNGGKWFTKLSQNPSDPGLQ